MAQRSETIETTPREQMIIGSVVSYTAKVGWQRIAEKPWPEVRAWVEQMCADGGGGIVYGNGMAENMPASCLVCTYRSSKGWKLSDVMPEGFEL